MRQTDLIAMTLGVWMEIETSEFNCCARPSQSNAHLTCSLAFIYAHRRGAMQAASPTLRRSRRRRQDGKPSSAVLLFCIAVLHLLLAPASSFLRRPGFSSVQRRVRRPSALLRRPSSVTTSVDG